MVIITATLSILIVTASAAAAVNISLVPGEKTVNKGSVTTFDIVLDNAPNGLAGYKINVSASDPGTANITAVSFPEWTGMNMNGSLPTKTLMISGLDLNHKIENGSTNITLATITVQGGEQGRTGLNISITELDADDGSPIQSETKPAQLTTVGDTPAVSGSIMPKHSSTPEPSSSASAPQTAASAAIQSGVLPYVLALLGLVAVVGVSILVLKFWKGK